MKFGIGQPMRRHEDLRLITGRGRYTDDVSLPQMTQAFVLRSPVAHAHIKRLDAEAARRMPGVLFVATGEDIRADGLGDVPCTVPLDQPRRHAAPRYAAARACARQGAARRSAGGLGRCRDFDRCARRRGSDRGRVRRAAGGHRGEGCGRRRCAAAFRPHSRQYRLRLGQRDGRRQGDRGRVRQGGARRHARTRQQPRRGQLDGAAQRHCRVRSGKRPLDALHGDARPAFRARPARRNRAQDAEGKTPPDHAQCRRRLRHEGLRLSRAGARRVGQPQDRTAGKVAGGSLGRVCFRQSGPRSLNARRTGAR